MLRTLCKERNCLINVVIIVIIIGMDFFPHILHGVFREKRRNKTDFLSPEAITGTLKKAAGEMGQ